MVDKSNRSRKTGSNKVAIIVLTVALVAAVGLGIYLYMQNQDLRNNPESSQQAQQDKANKMKDKVAKLIEVPTDETPTLATVTDADKLKDQPFFQGAQNDDVILLFPQAKRAIIYRESENKLINVGPIAITSDSSAGTTKEEVSKE